MRKTIILCFLLISSCSLLSDNKLSSKHDPDGSSSPAETSYEKTEFPLLSQTPSSYPSATDLPAYTTTPDILQTLLPGSKQPLTKIQEYQPERWTIYHMGSDDFPGMMIFDIASGPDGLTWIASTHGLTRIDGEKTTTFTEEDGLISNNAYAVAVDNDGTVWVGTENGVSTLDGNSWQSYTTDDGLFGNYVRYISIESNGTIWFVTENRTNDDFQYGITSYYRDTWTTFSSEDGLPSGRLGNIVVDQNGSVWAGTEHGLAQYDGNSWRVFHRSEYWTTTYNYLNEAVSFISLAPDGKIWFYTSSLGLTNFDGHQWKNFAHPGLFSIYLASITVAPNNNIWICGADGSKEHYQQLIMFDGEDWTAYEIPITSWCFDVFAPLDGSIWVATEASLMQYDIP